MNAPSDDERYFDIDGKPTTLERLCKDEPEWAANVIRHLRGHRDRLQAELLESARLNEELRRAVAAGDKFAASVSEALNMGDGSYRP